MLGILDTEPENTIREINIFCWDFLIFTHTVREESLIRSAYSQDKTVIPSQKPW
jgi:hypothetical protein